jgi:hypothetical protein
LLGKDIQTNNVTNVACTAIAVQQANKQRCYATRFQTTDHKHVPVAMNINTTIELLLETMFSTQSVQIGYKKDNWGGPVS